MANPYSYDLRRKVIEAIELNGMKCCEASAAFNISRNTINTWFQRRAETGDLHPNVSVIVWTERRKDVIRIISARRANCHEQKRFEQYLSY